MLRVHVRERLFESMNQKYVAVMESKQSQRNVRYSSEKTHYIGRVVSADG